jgi:AcrR family transcriptional regulator
MSDDDGLSARGRETARRLANDPHVQQWLRSDEGYDPRKAAGETKRRRTREKLIQAADHVMREQGNDATVEAIAEDAGVSTATFYTFFRTRNELCYEAFTDLVLEPLHKLGIAERPYTESMHLFLQQCEGRSGLVRGALGQKLDNPMSSAFKSSNDGLIDYVAGLIREAGILDRYSVVEVSEGVYNDHLTAMQLLANWLLTTVAWNMGVNETGLQRLIDRTLPEASQG